MPLEFISFFVISWLAFALLVPSCNKMIVGSPVLIQSQSLQERAGISFLEIREKSPSISQAQVRLNIHPLTIAMVRHKQYSKFPGLSHTVLGDGLSFNRSKWNEKKVEMWLLESAAQHKQQMFTVASLTSVCGRIQERNGLKNVMTQIQKMAPQGIFSLASV